MGGNWRVREFQRLDGVFLLMMKREDEDEEFGGSLVKRYVPRSGLVLETPVQSRGVDFMSERKGVLERLFKLTSIGQTVKSARIAGAVVERQ